jgi:hypothetical protein
MLSEERAAMHTALREELTALMEATSEADKPESYDTLIAKGVRRFERFWKRY